ncbi:MAG: 30S ribosomal protein S6 [Spirochaetaceae bacterium]|jgi:small subunit ribosomal protein S6|nr:30S ribosomal protein S6 [Spirochaetaceae bacterium]
MRLYELTAIFPIEEALLQECRELLQSDLEKAGAVIEKTDEIGDRDLAYEIKKRKRGKYVLYTLKLDPEKIAGLDKVFHLNANLIRYLFVRVE